MFSQWLFKCEANANLSIEEQRKLFLTDSIILVESVNVRVITCQKWKICTVDNLGCRET